MFCLPSSFPLHFSPSCVRGGEGRGKGQCVEEADRPSRSERQRVWRGENGRERRGRGSKQGEKGANPGELCVREEGGKGPSPHFSSTWPPLLACLSSLLSPPSSPSLTSCALPSLRLLPSPFLPLIISHPSPPLLPSSLPSLLITASSIAYSRPSPYIAPFLPFSPLYSLLPRPSQFLR